jgi:hypothetical protein
METTLTANDNEKPEVTQEQINDWKRMYGAVYSVRISGKPYIYRGLMRAEFKNIARNASLIANQIDSNTALEEANVEVASLHPKITKDNINSVPAGVITVLSGHIMEASGFDDTGVPQQL